MKICLKTIAIFCVLAGFVTIGISKEKPKEPPKKIDAEAPKREIRRTRKGEEVKEPPVCVEEEYDENTIFLFPKEKPINREDSIEMEQRVKDAFKHERQKYLAKVEDNIEFLEKNFDKPVRRIFPPIEQLQLALDLRALPVLSKVALHNPRIFYRTAAVGAIGGLERFNKDTSFVFVLREALKDSSEDVQLVAALALVRLGRENTSVISILEKIAKGIEEENWLIDYKARMGTLEYLTEEECERCKRVMRNGLRRRAILALGYLGVKKGNQECTKLIEELRQMPQIKRKFLRELEIIRQNYGLEAF
jgi:hypothetical protein